MRIPSMAPAGVEDVDLRTGRHWGRWFERMSSHVEEGEQEGMSWVKTDVSGGNPRSQRLLTGYEQDESSRKHEK
jgi:hypothetical protein